MAERACGSIASHKKNSQWHRWLCSGGVSMCYIWTCFYLQEPHMTTVLSLKEHERKEFNCALALSPQVRCVVFHYSSLSASPSSLSSSSWFHRRHHHHLHLLPPPLHHYLHYPHHYHHHQCFMQEFQTVFIIVPLLRSTLMVSLLCAVGASRNWRWSVWPQPSVHIWSPAPGSAHWLRQRSPDGRSQGS
jgi:hypothetical protein